jgi:rhodanese-related sulfurtransferase
MATRIWLDRLLELIEHGAQVAEVLPADDYAPVHLPGAINLPLRELDAQAVTALNPGRPIVVYCWDSL